MSVAEKQALLKRAVERIGGMPKLTACERDYFVNMVCRAAGVEGVESVFQRINERDDDMVVDHLAEIRHGVLFQELGFLARFEPAGSKGPDLMVERGGVSAFVEVKRYRPKGGDAVPESLGQGATLSGYGGTPACTQARIEEDLLCKVRQIEPRNGVQHGILAIWSDRSSVEDDVFKCAIRRISPRQARQKGLRFCIFGSDWVTVGMGQRFYCEPVSLPEVPFRSWAEDIQDAN
jgi:hypothetical protein